MAQQFGTTFREALVALPPLQAAGLPEVIRPLGAVEEMFAAYAEAGCMTFSIVTKVRGEISHERLQAGVSDILRSHAQLGLAIRRGYNGRRVFTHSTERPPVTVLNIGAASWEEVVELELTLPFTDESALFRVTALVGGKENVLILTFHHGMADGLSGVAVTKDLLLAMSGAELPQRPDQTADTLEQCFGPDYATGLAAAANVKPPSFPPARNRWAAKRAQPPVVRSFVLSTEATDRLVARAKEERTTVHAALLAAMARARHSLRPEAYPAGGLRIMSPTNLRPHVSPSSPIGVYVGGAITISPPPTPSSPAAEAWAATSPWGSKPPTSFWGEASPTPSELVAVPFWDEARALGDELAPQRGREAALGLVMAADLQMRRDPSANAATKFMRTATDHEGLISNLGCARYQHAMRRLRDCRRVGTGIADMY